MDMPENFESFQLTLTDKEPSPNWPDALRSLWYDAKGNWEASHDIAQEMHNNMGSWIYAYLHRKEGDEFNARFWYRQAGKPFLTISFEEEHKQMVELFLGN